MQKALGFHPIWLGNGQFPAKKDEKWEKPISPKVWRFPLDLAKIQWK